MSYVVTVPDDNGELTDTLWLQSIGGAQYQRLPVPDQGRVTGLWWTADGLLWQSGTLDQSDGAVTVSRLTEGFEPEIVYAGSLFPVVTATPEASPVAIGSPVASPVASPEASPAAATPDAAAD